MQYLVPPIFWRSWGLWPTMTKCTFSRLGKRCKICDICAMVAACLNRARRVINLELPGSALILRRFIYEKTCSRDRDRMYQPCWKYGERYVECLAGRQIGRRHDHIV